MTFDEALAKAEQQAATLVWWSPDQIARGEDVVNDPKKGERAWAVPPATGRFLHDRVMERKPVTILELGTSIGYSTLWLAHAASAYGGHVHTIENRDYKMAVAQANIADAGLNDTVTLHHGEIGDILQELAAQGLTFDLVFMDADRGHYHEYFPTIEKRLSPGALVIADNAGNMNARMQPFLKLLADTGWQHEIKDMDNGVLVASR